MNEYTDILILKESFEVRYSAPKFHKVKIKENAMAKK